MAKMSTPMKGFKRERLPESLRELYPLWVSKDAHDRLACEYWEAAYRYKEIVKLPANTLTAMEAKLIATQKEIMEQYLNILAKRLTLIGERE